MDLSIIIVSWKVKDKLRENLRAIFMTSPTSSLIPLLRESEESGDISFEVFVVDNNSGDGTVEMVRNEFPQVRLIVNDKNLGFAKANNQALRYAQGKYILLLNPDMRVFPDTLSNMVGWMDNHQEAAVAGCHLVNEKGETIKHVRHFPNVWNQLAIILKLPYFFPKILNNYLRSDFDYSQAAKVDSIRGGFFMIRREVIEKIGVLDERFFLWFEEVDYCRLVKDAGLEVWYTPAAECVDYMGQSFKQVKRGVAQKYFRDSMLKYFKKWHPTWQFYLLKVVWPIGLFLTWSGGMAGFRRKART